MRKLAATLFLATCLFASAVDEEHVFITVTNTAVTGDTITVNGVTRTWTNAHTATTILTNLASIGINNTASNLFANLGLFPLAVPRPTFYWIATNKFRMVFAPAYPGVVSMAVGWAEITNLTVPLLPMLPVRVPITSEPSSSNRIHIASRMVEGMELSTNYFKPGWTAATYLVGTTNAQVISGVKQLIDPGLLRPLLTNVVWLSGVIGPTTNGWGTNWVMISLTTTSLVNYGDSISSPGSASGSQQFGGGLATGVNSTALGDDSLASGPYSTAVGNLATASGGRSAAYGAGAEASGTNSAALGQNSAASGASSTAVGNGSGALHSNSVAIAGTTTADNQVFIGSAAHTVLLTGSIAISGTVSNIHAIGSNRVAGSWSLTRRTDSSQPTGHNIITNSASDNLVWLTAPAGACTNVGFTDGIDGRVIEYVKYNGGYSMGIANESGLASAERRVLTGTGADVTITNSPGWFRIRYDSTISRWILTGHSN